MTINCGIYIMYFECDDGQYYVGKSGNMQERYKEHCRKLKYGTHHNKGMQASYQKYGLPTMEPLEEVMDLAKQSEREKYWIKKLDTYNNGMNGTLGGDGRGFGADTPTSLYNKNTYIDILTNLANTSESLRDISNKLGVAYSVVQKISCGSEPAWLEKDYPELVAKVREKCGTHKGFVYDTDKYTRAMLMGMDRNNTLESISTTLELNLSVVKNILYGINHTGLKTIYPNEYAIMLSNKGLRMKGSTNRESYLKVRAPNGIIYQPINASAFAREHGLDRARTHELLRGKRKEYNGWSTI